MENPYSLLNYNMDDMEPTPEFEKATKFITDTITKMVNGIKEELSDASDYADSIGGVFYSNLHWGSIQKPQLTGMIKVDAHIAEAIKALTEFRDGPYVMGSGIGDTATDECIAYEVENLLNS